MSIKFITPTSEECLKILRNYGEQGDLLISEWERQLIMSISRFTAWKLGKSGMFPQRKLLGDKSCGWLFSNRLYWINER